MPPTGQRRSKWRPSRWNPPRPGATEGRLDVTWRSGVLVKRPEVASLVRSVLQRAELLVADGGQLLPRVITFKEPAPISSDITRTSSPLTAPSMPDGISFHEVRELPDGWRMTWKRESERHGSPLAQEAGVLLLFERPVSDHAVSRFQLRLLAGTGRPCRATGARNARHCDRR